MYFLSRYENKIDSKGRVSVPASYRGILEAGGQPLIVTRALNHECLEGQGPGRINSIVDALDSMNALSDEATALQALLTNAVQMKLDNEGRIMLAPDFIDYAKITDSVVFAGAGRMFQMWAPALWEKHAEHQREALKKNPPQLILKPAGDG